MPEQPKFKHITDISDAAKYVHWITQRGGVAVWESINLSNPGASWSTPAKSEDGQPTTRPTWQVGNEPSAIYTDMNDISLVTQKEVKRFRVGVRRAGMSIKVTDGGTRRIWAAVAKAGPGASYYFDYSTQEAVIVVPDAIISLADYYEKTK